MSVDNTIDRLKELVQYHQDSLRAIGKNDLTHETRMQVLQLTKNPLNEMITLIKRLD